MIGLILVVIVEAHIDVLVAFPMVFGTILIVLLVVPLVKGFILIHYAMLIVTCVHYLHCSSFPSKFILLKPVVIIAILKLPPISLVAETISRPRPITVVSL